jgi:hypothetical protein
MPGLVQPWDYLPPVRSVDDGYETWFEAAHNAILGFFVLELAVRLREGGWQFLRTRWGLLGTALILLSVLPCRAWMRRRCVWHGGAAPNTSHAI